MKKKFLLILFLVLIISGVVCIKYIGPYGSSHLPEWVEKGNVIVAAIEAYRQEHGHYPEALPFEPDVSEIPGCRAISYFARPDENGEEYFHLTFVLHFREAVIYDSRKNLGEEDSWGTYKMQDDWMWTLD